jgi:hypothetical protein
LGCGQCGQNAFSQNDQNGSTTGLPDGFIFIPKIPIWVNEMKRLVRFWNILWQLGIIYDRLV